MLGHVCDADRAHAFTYRPVLFSTSIAIAIVASFAALWLAFHLRQGEGATVVARVGAAIVMGLAISGMHYAGMAASQFAPESYCLGVESKAARLATNGWLGLIAAVSTLTLLGALRGIDVLRSTMPTWNRRKCADTLCRSSSPTRSCNTWQCTTRLTGLANRTLLEQSVPRRWNAPIAPTRKFAVLLVDLADVSSPSTIHSGHQHGL